MVGVFRINMFSDKWKTKGNKDSGRVRWYQIRVLTEGALLMSSSRKS